MSTEPDDHPRHKVLDRCINDLMEHFDSVQIFVTERHDDRENHYGRSTWSIEAGAGNFYARYGQARSWVNKQEQHDRLDAEDQRKQ